jgi:hypothetical protein
MQRIDENTYIDDTLVTCAEYQLFIDEMREHGKYYQPDHWTEYRFPKGRPQQPILGMRPSDAVAFCEWLTDRQEGWNFRIPILEETQKFPVSTIYPFSIGYWTTDNQWKMQFIWIGAIPSNPRGIDFDAAFDNDEIRARANYFDRDHIENAAYDRTIIFDRSCKRDLDVECAKTMGYVLWLLHERNRDNDGDSERDRAQRLARDRVSDQQNYHAFRKDMNNALNLDRIAFRRENYQENEPTSVYFLEIYSDLITIRERIVGRSPAFEGIRLVKERIK